MKLLGIVLILIFPINAPSQPLWDRLFHPKKPEHHKKMTHHVKHKSVKTLTPKPGYFVVDAQWIANYTEQEARWNYYLPDDSGIKFENNQYHVPVVVYRHYEDMVNASAKH